MFNLYQILLGAQGGQALDNLAERFGLTKEQANSAVQALIPALSTAFMTKAMHPGGMQEIAGAMADDDHRAAFADPQAALTPQTQQKSDDIASSIFGNSAMIETVVQQAARYTGLSEDTLRGMLPVVISMVLGGVASAMHSQGLGGWLGQLATGGLGGMFGGGAPGAPAGGGLGGMFGSILGNMLGGGQAAQPTPNNPSPGTRDGEAPAQAPGGFPGMPSAMQEMFGKMFQPGVPTPGPMGGDLAGQIGAILSGKRG